MPVGISPKRIETTDSMLQSGRCGSTAALARGGVRQQDASGPRAPWTQRHCQADFSGGARDGCFIDYLQAIVELAWQSH